MRKAAEKSLLADDTPQCLEGKECYVAALYLTIVMTFICILLSVWAGWRDRRKLQEIARSGEGKARGSRRQSRTRIERE